MRTTCSGLMISMTKHKAAVTPLLAHWSYCSLAPALDVNELCTKFSFSFILLWVLQSCPYKCITLAGGRDVFALISVWPMIQDSSCVTEILHGSIFLTEISFITIGAKGWYVIIHANHNLHGGLSLKIEHGNIYCHTNIVVINNTEATTTTTAVIM